MSSESLISIGVDPGRSGGIAWLDPGRRVLSAHKMPEDSDLPRFVWEHFGKDGVRQRCAVVIEQIGPQPIGREEVLEAIGQAPGRPGVVLARKVWRKRWPAIQDFGRLAHHAGLLVGLFGALDIPGIKMQPKDWRRVVGLEAAKRHETASKRKNRAKARAAELFPGVRLTHAIAEAVLMAEACRRIGGQIRSEVLL